MNIAGLKMFIGAIYTTDVSSNDLVIIYAKDRTAADGILKQYMEKLYSDIEDIEVIDAETYMPEASDATILTQEYCNL